MRKGNAHTYLMDQLKGLYERHEQQYMNKREGVTYKD